MFMLYNVIVTAAVQVAHKHFFATAVLHFIQILQTCYKYDPKLKRKIRIY